MWRSVVVLLACLAPEALSQGHGNGLAKSTYAVSSDELARRSLHWLIKVFNMTASRDSEPANVAHCSAGDSWTKRDW